MNLDAYLDRIGLANDARGNVRPDLACLSDLTRLHTCAIAFENLNSLLRLPVALELAALEAKLVGSRRGGYCFEQNALFAAVLERIGYRIRRLAARVVWGQDDASQLRNPRTHMVLLVDVDAQRYLCDVGFGGVTPTAPLLLDSAVQQQTPHEPYRLVTSEGVYTLQVLIQGQWRDVYVFDLQPQAPADYEMANHYVCTHPTSHFRSTLMAARAFDGGRYHLRNRLLTTYAANGDRQERQVHGTEEIAAVLDELFGITVPDQDSFAAALARHIDGDDLSV